MNLDGMVFQDKSGTPCQVYGAFISGPPNPYVHVKSVVYCGSGQEVPEDAYDKEELLSAAHRLWGSMLDFPAVRMN